MEKLWARQSAKRIQECHCRSIGRQVLSGLNWVIFGASIPVLVPRSFS